MVLQDPLVSVLPEKLGVANCASPRFSTSLVRDRLRYFSSTTYLTILIIQPFYRSSVIAERNHIFILIATR